MLRMLGCLFVFPFSPLLPFLYSIFSFSPLQSSFYLPFLLVLQFSLSLFTNFTSWWPSALLLPARSLSLISSVFYEWELPGIGQHTRERNVHICNTHSKRLFPSISKPTRDMKFIMDVEIFVWIFIHIQAFWCVDELCSSENRFSLEAI